MVKLSYIELEEFKKEFLRKYLPREKREVKVEEFINPMKDTMSVDEYSLMFTLMSKYAPTLMSSSRYEMSRFVSDVSNLVKEKCHTTMLHDDMN